MATILYDQEKNTNEKRVRADTDETGHPCVFLQAPAGSVELSPISNFVWFRPLAAYGREMKRVVRLIHLLCSLCFCLRPVASEAAEVANAAKPVIALQPLGDCLAKDIEQARKGILALYDCEVKVAPAVALPQKAYYEPRARYRADQLLNFLAVDVKLGFECVKVVGLTAKDISCTKGEVYDWGIFGLGSLDGKTCVISTYRLGAGKADAALKTQRLIKVINHEIGHTFGLEHCPVNRCLMQDARGLIKTVDGENGSFCEKCHKRLEKVLRVK